MADENQEINHTKEEDDDVPVVVDESTPLPSKTGRVSGSYGQLLEATMPEKRSWPELEGLTAEEAEKKIKEEMPGAEVRVIPHYNFVTMDFRTNRVRIFADSSNKVVRAPMIG